MEILVSGTVAVDVFPGLDGVESEFVGGDAHDGAVDGVEHLVVEGEAAAQEGEDSGERGEGVQAGAGEGGERVEVEVVEGFPEDVEDGLGVSAALICFLGIVVRIRTEMSSSTGAVPAIVYAMVELDQLDSIGDRRSKMSCNEADRRCLCFHYLYSTSYSLYSMRISTSRLTLAQTRISALRPGVHIILAAGSASVVVHRKCSVRSTHCYPMLNSPRKARNVEVGSR